MARNQDFGILSSTLASFWRSLTGNRRCSSLPGAARPRRLHFETCEQRTLLSVVSGTVFEDLNGNGVNDDGSLMADVTIELYNDTNGNQQFDSGVDTLFGSTTTDGAGQYGFLGVPDGQYLIGQIVPAGYTPTLEGPAAGYYPFTTTGGSGGLLIDSFAAPDPMEFHIIETPGLGRDPTVTQRGDPAILGGERDVLIDVLGSADLQSAIFRMGEGELNIGMQTPGSLLQLQYDGPDANGPDNLTDSEMASPADVTLGGTNTGLRIDFTTVETGGAGNPLEVRILATSSGGTAEFLGQVPEVANPTFFTQFSSFAVTPGFSFQQITRLDFIFNESGAPNVDFTINSITGETDGESEHAFNFGNRPTEGVSVSGLKFNDLNGNGINDDGVLLPGVTIELYRDENANGQFDQGIDTLLATQLTDGSGNYSFDNLFDGNYLIGEVVPAGFTPTKQGPAAGYYPFEITNRLVGLLVDNFASPDPFEFHVLVTPGLGRDPTVTQRAGPGILGGERDVLIDVLGTPDLQSALFRMGEGELNIGMQTPGSVLQLQYDGLDSNGPDTLNPSLMATPVDVTSGGTNDGLLIDLTSLETGGAGNPLDVRIIATSSNGVAEFFGAAPEVANPSFFVPFASFFPSQSFSFEQVTRLDFIFNEQGEPNVDITIEGIVAQNLEGDGFDFGNRLEGTEIKIEKATNAMDADPPSYNDPNVVPWVPVGSAVTWTYVVTNPGNSPLMNVSVTDSKGVTVAFQGGDTHNIGQLDTDETWTYTASGVAQAGPYENIGTATALDQTQAQVTDVDPSHYFGVQPGIHIEKATNGMDADLPDYGNMAAVPWVHVGDVVNWTYVVTNTGNVSLSNVSVVDSRGLATGLPSGDDGNGLLDPGETWSYAATGFAQIGPYENLATVTALSPLETQVTDDDPSHYLGIQPGIHIEKATNGVDADTPDQGPALVQGSTVTWTYEVTNTGNVPLSNIQVTDNLGPLPGFVSGDDGDGLLETGEKWIYQATGTALDTTGNPGGAYANLGTVTGMDPLERVVSAEDPSHYRGFPEGTTGSISGYVYIDVNDDGVKDPQEMPIPQVIVRLVGVGFDKVVLTDTTGYYEFDFVPLGKYTIIETQPQAFIDGKDTIGPEAKAAGGQTGEHLIPPLNDQFLSINLGPDEHFNHNNFGEKGLIPPLVSKRILIWPYTIDITRWRSWGPNDSWQIPLWAGPDNRDGGTTTNGVPATAAPGGADGADLFEFVAGETAADWVVKINGVVQDVDPLATGFHFEGGGGRDVAILTGTGGSESLTLGEDYAVLIGDGFAVTVNGVEEIRVQGLAGEDVANLYGSRGDDNLVIRPGSLTINGATYEHLADGFETVHADGTAGGLDVAKLFDSDGDDLYVAEPDQATLSGEGFYHQVAAFEGVHAYGSAGVDVAKLFDSDGDDKFVAWPTEAVLYGPGFYNRAVLFDAVHAYATAGGLDVATMFDSDGDDAFVAKATEAVLLGNGFYNRAKYFEGAHGYATAAGHDRALFYDSPGNDVLAVRSTWTAMYSRGYYNRAKFFEQIEADASAGGDDTAYLSGSEGNDYLQATGPWARLFWLGHSASLSNFDTVKAYSSGNGNDMKHVEAVDFVLLTDNYWRGI